MTQASAKLQTCYGQKCPIRSEDIQVQETYLDFSRVSKIISETLKNKIHFELLSLITVFRSDLEKRIKNIKQVIEKELPWKLRTKLIIS